MRHWNFKVKYSTQGIAVYIRETLCYNRIDSKSSRTGNDATSKEIISLAVDLKSKQMLNLVVLYCSPSRNYVDTSNIKNVFENWLNSPYGRQVKIRDFNKKDIDWNSFTLTCQNDYPFMEAVIDSYLTQHYKTPTRGRGTSRPSGLDLFSHLEKGFIKDIKMESRLGKSRRSLIKLSYQYELENI